MNCGSAISDTCASAIFPLNKEIVSYTSSGEATYTLCTDLYETVKEQNNCIIGRTQDLVAELIYVATFLITTSLTTAASSLSKNMVKGLNAMRCAISSGGVNIYNLIAAAYFAARQFGYEGEIQTYLNEYWPYACTCIEDVDQFGQFFGGNEDTANEFKTCN